MQYKQEAAVGFLVMVATAIMIGGFMWLSGAGLGASQIHVQVQFTDVMGLNSGDPVRVSGVTVGRVSDVRLEDMHRVMVEVELNSADWRPRIDARAQVSDVDLLGQKYLNYRPGTASEFLAEDQVITGIAAGGPVETVTGIADQASAVLTGLEGMLQQHVRDEVLLTLESTRAAMQVVQTLEPAALFDDASQTMTAVQATLAHLDRLLSSEGLVQGVDNTNEAISSLRAMATDVSTVATQLNELLELVNEGNGSIGLAFRDSSLFHNANGALVSLRELLDDMKERPGRYFKLEVF